MEVELCTCCGLVAWGCSFVLLGGGRRVGVSEHGLIEGVRRVLIGRAATTPLAARMLRSEAVCCACDEISGATANVFGSPLTRAEAGGLIVFVGCSSPLVGWAVSRSPLGALGLMGMLGAGLVARGAAIQRKRKRELAEEMPAVFRTLAVALGSGQTLSQAIAYVGAHEKGPAAHGFYMASMRLRCGESAEAVLAALAEELQAPGMGLLVTALTISQRTGSPLKDLFQRSARLVEREQGLSRELSVKTAQVRLSARVVCLLPLMMVALLSLISPEFQSGVTTPLGMCCIGLAIAMDAVAILIMRRLMKGVL